MSNKWIKPSEDLPFEGEPVEVTFELSDGRGKRVAIGKLRVAMLNKGPERTWDIYIPERHEERNFYFRVVTAWRKPVPAND